MHLAFDGGLMTSDAGILLLAAIDQRLGIAERLANCVEDPPPPERVRHTLTEMIRERAPLIAAGYPDGNGSMRSAPIQPSRKLNQFTISFDEPDGAKVWSEIRDYIDNGSDWT